MIRFFINFTISISSLNGVDTYFQYFVSVRGVDGVRGQLDFLSNFLSDISSIVVFFFKVNIFTRQLHPTRQQLDLSMNL